jgi:hypothetical protein
MKKKYNACSISIKNCKAKPKNFRTITTASLKWATWVIARLGG